MAVQRALSQILAVPTPPTGAPDDAGHRPIAYRLEELNGGKDPYAPHCADWSYGCRTPTADCIGFVLWSTGVDRLQPTFAGLVGPWLHCGSLLADARGAKVWCELVTGGVLPGDWLLTEDHIGMVVRPAPSPDFDHLVVDCSPRHGRNAAINTGGPWSGACQAVRYKHYAA